MPNITQLVNINALVFDERGYANIMPSLIPNTEMNVRSTDGGLTIRSVRIKPLSSFVLHDKTTDYTDIEDETIIRLGFSPSSVYVSVGANYDFSENTTITVKGVDYTAYGSREFFAIPESEIDSDVSQTFGGSNELEHEVM